MYLSNMLVDDIPLSLKYLNKIKLNMYYVFILLLFYYWLLVSASRGHHQANIYKKIKNKKNKILAYILQKRQFCGVDIH
jgi:hypothetical protein